MVELAAESADPHPYRLVFQKIARSVAAPSNSFETFRALVPECAVVKTTPVARRSLVAMLPCYVLKKLTQQQSS
jgi:hypothetical protein